MIAPDDRLAQIRQQLSDYQRYQRHSGEPLGGPLMAYLRDVPELLAQVAALQAELARRPC